MDKNFDDEAYIRRYYGSCRLRPCPCQVESVRYRLDGEAAMNVKLACLEWTPTKARSWREM